MSGAYEFFILLRKSRGPWSTTSTAIVPWHLGAATHLPSVNLNQRLNPFTRQGAGAVKTILGLDIGTNSIGCAWVDLEAGTIELSVGIFPAGV